MPLITLSKYYTFAKKHLPIHFHLADRRSRSGGVIFKILTFLKCPKKHFFLVIILFGILNQIFPKINFWNVWAFSFYVLLDFFDLAKIWDFIKDFAWLGQNEVKQPTIYKRTKSISTGWIDPYLVLKCSLKKSRLGLWHFLRHLSWIDKITPKIVKKNHRLPKTTLFGYIWVWLQISLKILNLRKFFLEGSVIGV